MLDVPAAVDYKRGMNWTTLRNNLEHRHWPRISQAVPSSGYSTRYSGLPFYEAVLCRVYHNLPFRVKLKDPPGKKGRYYPPVSTWYYRLNTAKTAAYNRNKPSTLLGLWGKYLSVMNTSELRAWRTAFDRCMRRQDVRGRPSANAGMLSVTPWFLAMSDALDRECRSRRTSS